MSGEPSGPAHTEEPSAANPYHELDRRIVKNSLWVGLSFGGGQVLTFAAMLVLARVLTPRDFGTVALATTLVSALAHIQESGVGAALVHFRANPHKRASSALVFSTGSGLALTGLVALTAPAYARFVHNPDVAGIVGALSLLLFVRGLTVVPNAILERELDFRTRVKSDLSGLSVQAVVSVSCALGGLGAWSLVFGLLSGAVTQAVAVWILIPWRPSPRHASWSTLREMLRYGRFVGAANLLNLLNNSMDNLVVGRVLGSGSVGVYAVAWRLAELPVTVIGPIVGRVMFSVYSQLQEDRHAVRRAYVQNTQRTVILGLAPTIALGLAADPIVPALLGPQWTQAETPLRILCVFAFVRLVAGPAGELFKGVGKPHLSLAATSIFTVVALTLLLVLVRRFGLDGAAISMVIGILAATVFTIPILMRELRLPALDFARSLARPVACSVPLAVTVLALVPVAKDLSPAPGLLLLIVAAVPVYLASLATIGRPIVMPVWTALRGAA